MLWHVGVSVGSWLYLLWYAYSPKADLLLKAVQDINTIMQENEMANFIISFSSLLSCSVVSFLCMLAVTLLEWLADKFYACRNANNE